MMQTTVQNIVKPYKEMVIDSSKLEVPRNTYQRDQKLRQFPLSAFQKTWPAHRNG